MGDRHSNATGHFRWYDYRRWIGLTPRSDASSAKHHASARHDQVNHPAGVPPAAVGVGNGLAAGVPAVPDSAASSANNHASAANRVPAAAASRPSVTRRNRNGGHYRRHARDCNSRRRGGQANRGRGGRGRGGQANRGRGGQANRGEREDWDLRYEQADPEVKQQLQDYRAPRLANPPHQRETQQFDMAAFAVFLLGPMNRTRGNTDKTWRIINRLYNGDGFKNKAWGFAFLGGQRINTLDFDMPKVIAMAGRAQDVLGDSSKGYLTHCLRYLWRYQKYRELEHEMDPIAYANVDWDAYFLSSFPI